MLGGSGMAGNTLSEDAPPIDIAVIGCGTVAQTVHIPNLLSNNQFRLRAVCDQSLPRAGTVGEKFGVAGTYADVDTLLDERSDIEAIVDCTPPYARRDATLPALRRDRHVLTEKPLAIAPEDATTLTNAAEQADSIAMVGYMKRYTQAYEDARATLDGMDDIKLTTVTNVDPDFGRLIADSHDLVGMEKAGRDWDRQRTKGRMALGLDDETIVDSYTFHLEHACHDLNLLQAEFGPLTAVEHVDLFDGGTYAVAVLEFGDRHRCVLESGLTERGWFDHRVQVNGGTEMVELEFPNPFLADRPASLRVKSGTTSVTDRVTAPPSGNGFVRELRQFARCVRNEDATVRTPFGEAAADVRAVADIVRRGSEPETRRATS